MPRPTLCRNWLRNNAHARDYLRGLAHGDIPLSHEALLDLPSWRTAAHLCDLLMAAGALVAVDRQILLFERWYRSEVKAVAGRSTRRPCASSPPGGCCRGCGPGPQTSS